MAGVSTLRDTFLEELRDLYNAEKQLTRALPKLAKAASTAPLADVFESHLEDTLEHVERLERVFGILGESARGRLCQGMAGIIDEGKERLGDDLDGDTRDAALVAAAQRAEHYEIAAYGTVVAWARALGYEEAAALLQQTLDEEKAADEKLTSLALGGINDHAADRTRRFERTGPEHVPPRSRSARPFTIR